MDLSETDINRYPNSLLAALSRWTPNDSAVQLDWLTAANLRLLSAIYKRLPVPSRHMHASKDMYTFIVGNDEVDLLHYCSLNDAEVVEEQDGDDGTSDITLDTDIGDDFVLDLLLPTPPTSASATDVVEELLAAEEATWDEGLWM